jgi:hypothetical protein
MELLEYFKKINKYIKTPHDESLEKDIFHDEKQQPDPPNNWNEQIKELEVFFRSVVLPTERMKISKVCTVTNATVFINSHLAYVKANNGKNGFLPYLERLHALKELLTINLN